MQSVKRVSLLRKKYLVKLRAQVIELLFRVTEETLKKRGNSVTDITKNVTDTLVYWEARLE